MNLETKITIYKFTPQLFTLTRIGALNEKDKTIKLLEEKVKRLETELAMIKNERKIG